MWSVGCRRVRREEGLAHGLLLLIGQSADEMSNRIRLVMTRLLTDEVLRLRFTFDRVKVLCELQAQGFELTPGELDLFMLSDADMWWWADRAMAATLH